LESVTLAARFRNGSVTYLELIGVFKKLRKDIKPQIRFPARVTESVTEPERTRDESVTPRSENVPLEPIQSNPKPIQSNPRTAVCVPEMIPIPERIDTPEFRAAWNRWQEHIRQKGQRPSQLTLTDQLIEANQLGATRAIAAIAHSIKNGWTGIFEAKENHKQQARKLPPI
jgi:hypothetical protein